MSFYSHFKGLVKRVRVNRSMETLLFTLLKWEAILLRAMGSSIKRPSQMLPRTGHITQDSKHFCSPDEMSISSKITLLGEVNFCDYSAKQQSQAVRVVAEIEKVEKIIKEIPQHVVQQLYFPYLYFRLWKFQVLGWLFSVTIL